MLTLRKIKRAAIGHTIQRFYIAFNFVQPDHNILFINDGPDSVKFTSLALYFLVHLKVG
jgi:hypothetical protein